MVGTTAEGLQSDYTRIRELEHDGLFELLKQSEEKIRNKK